MKDLSKRFSLAPAGGVLVGKRLAHWCELLEEWCLIHERYCRLVEDDAIYWNIERSNIAALASAAWRSGWAALEEFTHSKTLKRGRVFGRADLYLKSPDTEEYVEAKIAWPGRGRKTVNANETLEKLDGACGDVKKVHLPGNLGTRVGVVFAVPRFPAGSKQPVSEQLAPFFEELQNAELDAAAWCFPPLAKELIWNRGKHKDAYPGVELTRFAGGGGPAVFLLRFSAPGA
jgi:hypothetical protein